jgi:hypothetical protein
VEKILLKKWGGRTADVLPPSAELARMKTENKDTRSDNTLENLDQKTREWILEIAGDSRLSDMVVILKQEGIETSKASLSRFIRRDREKKLMEARNDSAAVVTELADGAKEGRLREGTLEAVRQQLYDQALAAQSPEMAQKWYAALVKEEAKLKELELEARKIAIAEEQLKLEAFVARAKLGGMAKAEVIESKREPTAIGAPEMKQMTGPGE